MLYLPATLAKGIAGALVAVLALPAPLDPPFSSDLVALLRPRLHAAVTVIRRAKITSTESREYIFISISFELAEKSVAYIGRI
jgi:hypothetical protein